MTVTGGPVLRDYQRECLDAIWARWRAGVRRQLVSLPTGTGKTVIFAQFPRFFRMKKRMLVLAHREELLEQARDKLLSQSPELRVDIEQAGRTASADADVVVASVATLGREGSSRLARFDPEQFYLVVVDEAHHATAPTYRRLLEYLGLFAPGTQKLLVGFTATPKRGDGEGLDAVFEEIVFARSLPDMIAAGHLAPVAGLRVETEVDLSRVRTRMGDFVASQLSGAVNVAARNDLVVKVYHDHLRSRRTLCFCVDVAHAQSLADAFRAAGVRVAAVSGDMDPAARRRALAAFTGGELDVLTNCMVLTEGYDESSVSGILLARPTRSSLLYTQMIGRGTRKHPGKADVLVVDVVDVTRDRRLVTLPSLFGLSPDFDLEGRTTTAVRDALDWVERHRPWVRADLATSLSDLRYRCEHVDLVELELPPELQRVSAYAWTAIGPGTYRLGLAGGEAVVVASTILGRWEVVLRERVGERAVTTADNAASAIGVAERLVARQRPDSVPLVARNRRWRAEPASEKQLAVLAARGLELPAGLTKGQASHMIAMLSGSAEGRRAPAP